MILGQIARWFEWCRTWYGRATFAATIARLFLDNKVVWSVIFGVPIAFMAVINRRRPEEVLIYGMTFALVIFVIMFFVAVFVIPRFCHTLGPVWLFGAPILIDTAARVCYEEMKGTRFDMAFTKGCGTANDILNKYKYGLITSKVPMFGMQPPSNRRQPIIELNPLYIVYGANRIGTNAALGEIDYENVSVSRSGLINYIKSLKATNLDFENNGI